jgi:hypothetical protein
MSPPPPAAEPVKRNDPAGFDLAGCLCMGLFYVGFVFCVLVMLYAIFAKHGGPGRGHFD